MKLKEIPNSEWFIKEACSIRGISDIIGVINGKAFFLEVKRSKKEADKKIGGIVLQRHFLEKMRKVGAFTEIIHPENELDILHIINTTL